MSGILFLTTEDFYLEKSNNELILCNNIKQGFSLILFYSTQCTYCQSLIPMFKTLPGKIGGCQFGMINVSQNKQCIMMSAKTSVPIQEVPYIILYVNGHPYMRYKGPQDIEEISRFLVEVSKQISSEEKNKQPEQNKNVKSQKNSTIPAYTTGVPICEGNVCYLNFTEAYE